MHQLWPIESLERSVCADTIWSGSRMSGAVSSVGNDGTTSSQVLLLVWCSLII